MDTKDLLTNNQEDTKEEYIKSVIRIADFIDNFSSFMVYNIKEELENMPKDMDKEDLVTFLTSLTKEVSDFNFVVKDIRKKFDI